MNPKKKNLALEKSKSTERHTQRHREREREEEEDKMANCNSIHQLEVSAIQRPPNFMPARKPTKFVYYLCRYSDPLAYS
jgi:hypothetical protein